MERPPKGGNRLLAALPPTDLALLSPHLKQVSLEQDAVVVRSGDRREYVYFPHSGAISFMLDMPNGATIATAMIGREGALGALSILGPSRSSVTAVVRVGGTASQISVSRFHAAYMGANGAVPFYADGADNAPGGLAIVGERGPELVNLPRGSQVILNDKLGKGGAIHIDASDNRTISIGEGASPESVAQLKSAFEQDRRERANQIVQVVRRAKQTRQLP
jgi:hypothetical protein